MCIYFEDGLNDEIKMMIRGTEIRQLVVLSDRAQKIKEKYNHKSNRENKSREFSKRNFSKSFFAQPPPKKDKEDVNRVTASSGFLIAL